MNPIDDAVKAVKIIGGVLEIINKLVEGLNLIIHGTTVNNENAQQKVTPRQKENEPKGYTMIPPNSSPIKNNKEQEKPKAYSGGGHKLEGVSIFAFFNNNPRNKEYEKTNKELKALAQEREKRAKWEQLHKNAGKTVPGPSKGTIQLHEESLNLQLKRDAELLDYVKTVNIMENHLQDCLQSLKFEPTAKEENYIKQLLINIKEMHSEIDKLKTQNQEENAKQVVNSRSTRPGR